MCLFGGDDSPSPPNLPPPPPREEMMDVIDKVNGVQSITVTENGKKKRIVERLPRTPEEEALFSRAGDLMSRASQNILNLYQYRPEDVVNFRPFIDTFANLNEETQRDLAQISDFGNITQQVNDYKQINRALLDEDIASRDRLAEENFAHRGISNSTAATEYRAAAARNADLARMQNNVNADIYGQDLAARRLATNSSAFALREQGRAGRRTAAELGYNLEQQKQQDLERRRDRAIQENFNLFNLGAGIRGEDQRKAMMSHAPEIANQTFAMMNADSLNRYNADINRQQANYQNQLAAYNSRPQSFGDKLLSVGGTIGGAMLTSPSNTLAGRAGNSIFGRWL